MASFDVEGALKVMRSAREKALDYADVAQVRWMGWSYVLEGFSLRELSSSDFLSIIRMYKNGLWRISFGRHPTFEDLLRSRSKFEKTFSIGVNRGFSQVSPIRAEYSIGDVVKLPEKDVRNFFESLMETFDRELGDLGVKLSATLRHDVRSKFFANIDGSVVLENKGLISLQVSMESGRFSVDEYIAFTNFDLLKSRLKELASRLVTRLRSLINARMFNPIYRGSKYPVILDPKASGVVLGSFIKALSRIGIFKRSLLGARIFSKGVTIVDDPSILWAAGAFLVDDEGSRAKPKRVVEDGYLVNILETRWSAGSSVEGGGGNARGLLYPPLPLYSNILVKPGDWKANEIVEETKIGFLVNGLRSVKVLEEGAVELKPQVAFLVEKGEIRTPVIIDRIIIPLRSARSISAVGNQGEYTAFIDEEEVVGAVSPYIKVEETVIS